MRILEAVHIPRFCNTRAEIDQVLHFICRLDLIIMDTLVYSFTGSTGHKDTKRGYIHKRNIISVCGTPDPLLMLYANVIAFSEL